MDNNFFGEIEDFLENFGSPGGNTILKDPSPPNNNNTTTTKAVLGERLKSRNGAEKRKLEDENTSLDAQGGYGEMTKNAKLDDSSDLRPEKELPRAPNRSTTLLAQALTEKRPLSNPSNNSILDPVSGALTKDDHHFYDDENNSSLNKPSRANKGNDEIRNYIKQNPNVNRLLTQLQSNKPGPKKGSNKMDAPQNNGFHGGDGFPPPHNNGPPSFDPQLSSPMDNPKDSLDFSPFDPSQQQGLMMGPNGMYNGPPNKAPSRRHINNNPCFNNAAPPQHYPQTQHELNWDYSNNNNNNNNTNKIMYNQPQPQQMRPMMMRQDLHGSRPQMNGSFPNEFGGMNPRGFNGGPNYGPPPSRGGPNMIPGGGNNNNNMYRRMGPYGANGPPYGGGGNPMMQQPQHQYSDNYNGYNVMDDGRLMGNGGDFGGGMPIQNNLPPPQRMNYGAMIPQPHGSPRMNSPGNMRYDQQHPQYDFGGNRFGNRYADYPQLNNAVNNNNNFQQQQPRPSYRPPMPQQTTQQLPPPPQQQQQQQQQNGFINGCLPGDDTLNETSEFPMMNQHPQQQPTTTHPHHQQQQHYTQRQQQSHHQTDIENCSSSWKNDASEMRKGLLDNLQKALGQDTSNASALAEQVELEAFNTSHTKESYCQRLAEWLAGIFSQQQQQKQQQPQQASPTQQSQDDSGSSSQTSTNSSNVANANSNSSSSNQNSNSIPDSTNKWFDPPGPDVSSTELLDGVLQLDSSEENKSTVGVVKSSSNNTNSASGNELNSDSNSNSSVVSNGSSGVGVGSNNNNNGNNNNSGTGGNSKSQVHPILSSLLPAPSSSSSSTTTKSVVDELFSSSHSSPSGTSVESSVVTSDSFQSPLTLSSSSASSTTNTTSSCSRRTSGKGGGGGSGGSSSGSVSGGSNNSTPNSSSVVNNPHSVDSGIGSPRSITSSSLYSPKIPQGTSPSLIPNSENSPDK